MNENILLVVDYDKICRLCLQTTGAMSDLFAENSKNSLKDMVLHATGLSVDKNHDFPTKICHKCLYMVEQSCELKNMVEKTNTLLINASSHPEAMEEEQAKDIEQEWEKLSVAIENPVPDKCVGSKKPDLKLVMQDNGVMALVLPEVGSTVEQKIENDKERKKHFLGQEDNIKIILKERKVLPKQLTCQICLTTFSDEADVNSHVNVHYVDSKLTPYTLLQRPYKCEICRKRLNKSQLIQHHRTHLNVNPFVCKHAGCKFVGKKQDGLRRHLLTHSPRTQVCEHCGATYKRHSELKQHMTRAHDTPTPSDCRICRKTFSNAMSLKKHAQDYHKPRRYKCEWNGCGKAYHTARCLTTHTRTHTNERLFKCHLCSAATYATQSLLNRHLRCHKRKALSNCDICSETFDDYGLFYKHRVAQHGRWLAYRCNGCQKRFQYEAKMEKHLETCEQAITTLDSAVPEKERIEHLLQASKQDVISYEDNILQLEEGAMNKEITEDLLDKFKGQPLVVQPGNFSDLSKDLDLQDLPTDGLLFIEVDSETVYDAWQQLTTQN
ncbi:hypothetical protein O0L34_g12802 [Tuta absoluta]|nr:hypothetical protein O0L34_g12802 [Tuta absoluta]